MMLVQAMQRHNAVWPIVCLFIFFLCVVLADKVPDRPQTTEQGKRVYYRAYVNQGMAAKQEGLYKEAIDALLFVVHTHTRGLPEWTLAANQLAITYELTGDQKRADEYYLLSAKYSHDAISMRKSAAYYRVRRKAQERSNATSI